MPAKEIHFTKMQGCGNDYVYINCFKQKISDPVSLAVKISNRNFGVGSDGLILICPSDKADCEMVMYNADGSRSEMCGNGIRCVAKYVYDNDIAHKDRIMVETLAGIKEIQIFSKDGVAEGARVNMGKPELSAALIPVLTKKDKFISEKVAVLGKDYSVTCISVGNPHAVTFIDDIDKLDIETIGPAFENNELFPKRINTEFVEVIDKTTLKMRVWERGSGETLACGTGATATLAAAVLNNKTERKAKIILRGGELEVEWAEDGYLYLSGPAKTVFDGVLYMEDNDD